MAKSKAEGKKGVKLKKWIGRLGLVLIACIVGAVIEVEKDFASEQLSPNDGKWGWILLLAFGYCIWTAAISCLIEGFKENTSQNKHSIKLNFLHRKDEGITSVEYEGDLVTLIIKDDGLSVVTKGTEQQVFDGEVNISPSNVPV